MATWRRKDLERRSGERSRRIGRVLRAEILIPVLALVVAGVALWQALGGAVPRRECSRATSASPPASYAYPGGLQRR